GPGDLERQRAVHAGRDLVGIATAVPDHEDDDQAGDEDDEERRDPEEEEQQRVGLRRQRRRLLGEDAEPLDHADPPPEWPATRRSRRIAVQMKSPSARRVRMPPARTAFRATRL